MEPLSIYIHVPFCTVKCSYCAFNIFTHLEYLIEPYVVAVCNELQQTGESNPGHPVRTIYFGGGTPTKLSAPHYQQILSTIRANFDLAPDVEISTEANPEDLQSIEPIAALVDLGVQRLSIGVQSTHQSQLELFGRLHDDHMVEVALANARKAGMHSVNLDLIYGIPYQTMSMWTDTLAHVVRLAPDHLSLYALGVEPKTALKYWIENGKVSPPDDDLAADMYEAASAALDDAGYSQYELSNWAKPGAESRHNIQYWRNHPYLGIGPGAHGYAGGVRYVVESSPHRYIKAMSDNRLSGRFPFTPAVVESTRVSREDEISETIMMGLRLLQEGIPLAGFQQRFGQDLLDGRRETIARYQQQGFLELTDETLRLTERGRFVSNRILADLI